MIDCLYMECPCTSFPRSLARDYKETFFYPPPSTLYGCLLSWVGEEDPRVHLGVKLAIGMIGAEPSLSRIMRKQRHHRFSKQHRGTYPSGIFSKPNFQEVLTDLRVAVKLDSSGETATVGLQERVAVALTDPAQVKRFGGLSLGESWALVNGIRPYREGDGEVQWLQKDPRGLISLPFWIDRTSGQGYFQRFRLGDFSDECWVAIHEPEPPKKFPRSGMRRGRDR